MIVAGKAKGIVKMIPREAWICATILIGIEIAALAVNIDLNRPTDQLLSFLATINSLLVTGVGLFIKLDKGTSAISDVSESLDRFRNGELDDKLTKSLEDNLPTLVGAILDARGVPVRSAISPATPVAGGSGGSASGVASPHDSPTNAPPTATS